MVHDTLITQSIIEYINIQFPNATTEEWKHEKEESINFKILDKDRTYVLRIMYECIEGIGPEEVKPMLENYNVAQVLRDIGDFPIIVTNSGCIFGSP